MQIELKSGAKLNFIRLNLIVGQGINYVPLSEMKMNLRMMGGFVDRGGRKFLTVLGGRFVGTRYLV